MLSKGDLTLPLQLCVDELEIGNPFGTSPKIHKVFTVYWVIASVPPKYRLVLQAIQLALLVKVTDLNKYGYAAVLATLLRDIHNLEQDGVFIERVDQNVRGAIFCVSADNLAAHGLGGFVESFRAGHVYRFCLGSANQFQVTEVGEKKFPLRTKASHNQYVQTVQENETLSSHFGVKGDFVLRKSLNYYHTITGFPPDTLHDLLEGIIPVELSLRIKQMIWLKYFTSEYLHPKITSFPYRHSDKVDKPHQIPKMFIAHGTIGGNGHENATLLLLLPLLVGSTVPEGDNK